MKHFRTIGLYRTAVVALGLAMCASTFAGKLPKGAFSGPTTQFKTFTVFGSAGKFSDVTSDNFDYQLFDDMSGVVQGFITISHSGPDGFAFMACHGPEFAPAIAANANGGVTIFATLDPASASCGGFGYFTPVVVNLVGQSNGNVHQIQSGTTKIITSGVIDVQTFNSDLVTETFNGSIGSVLGPFDGNLQSSRLKDVTKTK